ncbi:tail fiber domain-containing protein [Winogradskyella bathintestinalis]|uniref:Tail fiber domain-containing protein n=1 Tax=Winogradskyella bathintestinalis TaxID=3035208 RepID=A0ABT7ZVI0_9FLAO|nr:tail fiber domain-containing protein [Winogradskyella bathintestinalis]MDN3492728.1 tail fiber domain-containing protein [Winogradskyella bathintestinalis]
MRKFTLLLTAAFAFTFSNTTDAQNEFDEGVIRYVIDQDVNSPNYQQPAGSKIYKSHTYEGSRSGNGNSNSYFNNIGDRSIDLTFSDADGSLASVGGRGGGARMVSAGYGALGWGSFTAGERTRAVGGGSIAVGILAHAGSLEGVGPFGLDGGNAGQVAFGWRTKATGNGSAVMGHATTASGDHSFAMGNGTTASASGGVAFGTFNATTDAAFVIGNGSDGDNQSDAFVVNTDGSAVFAGDVTVNSDMRLKSNIMSLGSTVAKLLQIDGKSYVMKKNTTEQKIGLLAQDVQAVFPQLVKEANNAEGTLSVNYQGLIPVLINAIKEQQAEIEELKQMIRRN